MKQDRIGTILIIVGVVLFGLAGVLFVWEQLFLAKAELATATVTDNVRYIGNDTNNNNREAPYYCSELIFETPNGESVPYEVCSQLDSPPYYEVGQNVDVYYDPGDPGSTIQIREFRRQYGLVIAAIVAGVLSIIVGLSWVVYYWLADRRKANVLASQKQKR